MEQFDRDHSQLAETFAEKRAAELARILARGLLRLRPDANPPAEKVSESTRNELASAPEQSVTVPAG